MGDSAIGAANGWGVTGASSGVDSTKLSNILHRVVWGTPVGSGDDSSTLAERDVDIAAISNDAQAANNLELWFDGTGFSALNSSVGNVDAIGDGAITYSTAPDLFTSVRASAYQAVNLIDNPCWSWDTVATVIKGWSTVISGNARKDIDTSIFDCGSKIILTAGVNSSGDADSVVITSNDFYVPVGFYNYGATFTNRVSLTGAGKIVAIVILRGGTQVDSINFTATVNSTTALDTSKVIEITTAGYHSYRLHVEKPVTTPNGSNSITVTRVWFEPFSVQLDLASIPGADVSLTYRAIDTATNTPIQGVSVSGYNMSDTRVVFGTTPASGELVFGFKLNDSIYFNSTGPPDYVWVQRDTAFLIQDGDIDTTEGYQFEGDAPAASSVAAVTIFVKDNAGVAIKNIRVTAQFVRGNMIDSTGIPISNAIQRGKTDSDGKYTFSCIWSSTVIPATDWRFTVHTLGGIVSRTITVDRQTTITLDFR